jgi:hypothetical protein
MKTCKNIEVDSNEFVYPWLTNFENDSRDHQAAARHEPDQHHRFSCLFRDFEPLQMCCRFVFRDGAGSPAGRRESSRSQRISIFSKPFSVIPSALTNFSMSFREKNDTMMSGGTVSNAPAGIFFIRLQFGELPGFLPST